MDKRQDKRATLEAFERRVRPIYDALDSRNAKAALKLTNAALEKYPDSSLLKALKSVALLRTGRSDEAHKVCDELVPGAALDEQTLHLLLLSLKDLHRPQDIVTIYEAAHAKDPNNLDIMIALFNSHVRQGNVSKQQLVATKINKLSPCSRHLWWIVLSVMLQARTALRGDSVSALDPAKLMQLAESMVSRQTSKEGQLDGYEALLVYIDLLLAQGKSKEALDAVAGPLGSVATMAAERVHLQVVLLMTVGDLPAAASLLHAQLCANPDDWSSLQLYCECVMRPQASPSGDAADGGSSGVPAAQLRWPESSLLRLSGGLAEMFSGAGLAAGRTQTPDEQRAGYEAAQATVARLVELVEAPPTGNHVHKLTMRGPYLAPVETAYRASQIGLVSPSEVARSALSYIQRQGHLVSCAADLRPYTSRMDPESAAWLAEQLQALTRCAPDLADPAAAARQEQLKAVRRAVCCHQVLDDLGMPQLASPQEAVAHAGELMDSYAKCQALYSGLDERERGPADELPALAAASLVTAAACCSSEGQAVAHLLQAVLLLESCVRSRPYSAPMRLGLAALYSLLGCPEAVLAQCRRLEIKNIQLDSLSGHHLLPALLAYCPSSQDQLRQLLKEVLQLYNDHRKDSGETLAKAYESATYTKVLEFVAFRERLNAAHTRAVARAERMLLDVCQASHVSLDAAAGALSAACAGLPLEELPQLASAGAAWLRFNEDLSTRAAWYPPGTCSADLAPAAWWQARGSQCGQGYGRRWWASTASAESSAAAAAEFRQCKHAAVRGRWLVSHLLAGVAQVPGAPQGAALTELLRDLETCCGLDLTRSLEAQLEDRAQALDLGCAPAPSDFNLVLVGIFRTACQLAAVMQGVPAAAAGAPQGAAEAGDACPSLARVLEALAASIHRGVTDARQCAHRVLPGSVLNAASVLLHQHLSWLGLCIQVWHRFTKQPSYKKVKADPEVDRAHSGVAALKSSVVKACTSLASVLEPGSKAAAASGLEGVALAGGDGGQAARLWGWREGFDAAGRLQEVWKEQAKVARALLELSSQHTKTLGSLAL